MKPRLLTARGFTLVEMLVGLALLAVLALVSWRGVDALMATESRSRERTDAVARLQTSLAQWRTDLDAAVPTGVVSVLAFDGRVLRLTRSDAGSQPGTVRVVGWARRVGTTGNTGQWQRWQSAPLATQQAVRQAWDDAARWASVGNAGSAAQEGLAVTLAPLANWQLYYFRNNSWSNPLSSEGAGGEGAGTGGQTTGQENALETLPDAVRLVLDLPPGPGLTGRLSVEWLRPTYSRARS